MGRTVLLVGLAMVMAAALAVASLYRTDLDRARGALASGSRIVVTKAGPIEYAETGEGPALLSIHGSGGGFDQGLANAAALVGEGFRVIAPSRFGYLGTPVPADASPVAQAAAHAALLDQLGIDSAIVLGVSAGARSAVELALRYPGRVSALVLVVPALGAPGGPVPKAGGKADRLALWIANAGGDFLWWAAEQVTPSLLVRFLGVPPDVVAQASAADRKRVAAIVAGVQPLWLRHLGIGIDGLPDAQLRPLDDITIPTIVIAARDDLFGTLPGAQFAAAKIAASQLVTYDSGGHLLVGRQDDARNRILDFLDRTGLAPAR